MVKWVNISYADKENCDLRFVMPLYVFAGAVGFRVGRQRRCKRPRFRPRRHACFEIPVLTPLLRRTPPTKEFTRAGTFGITADPLLLATRQPIIPAAAHRQNGALVRVFCCPTPFNPWLNRRRDARVNALRFRRRMPSYTLDDVAVSIANSWPRDGNTFPPELIDDKLVFRSRRTT